MHKNQIQYWTGISAVNKKMLNALTSSELKKLAWCFNNPNSVRFEKLSGYKDVRSIRTSQEARILAIEKDSRLIVIDVLKNHEYEAGLRKYEAGLLKQFKQDEAHVVKKLVDLTEAMEEALTIDEAFDVDLETIKITEEFEKFSLEDAPTWQPVLIDSRLTYQQGEIKKSPVLLALDAQQSHVLERFFSGIISGPPGSGKTTIVQGLLSRASQLQGDERMLYVAQSRPLVRHIERYYRSIGGNEAGNVIFSTYDDLLLSETITSEALLKGKEAEQNCKDWLEHYLKGSEHYKSLSKEEKVSTLERLYQEFRIRSGYAKEDYLNPESVGKQQSLYDVEDREWVNEAYQGYLRALNQQNKISPAFLEHPEIGNYHTIFVDESQDFSNGQIRRLVNAAQENRIFFFFGGGQSLIDNLSNTIFFKKLCPGIPEIKLHQTYRCPENIRQVANDVHQLMLDSTPKQKKTDVLTQVAQSNEKEGYIGVWNQKGKNGAVGNARNFKKCLDEHLESSIHNTCVITHAQYQDKLIKEWGVPEYVIHTPSSVKGLEYGNIFIYEPFGTADFEIVEKNMQYGTRDIQCSSPLNELFVSLSRSFENCFIYTGVHRKNLNAFLLKAVAKANQDNQAFNLLPEASLKKEDVKLKMVERAIQLIEKEQCDRAVSLLRDQDFEEDEINKIIQSVQSDLEQTKELVYEQEKEIERYVEVESKDEEAESLSDGDERTQEVLFEESLIKASLAKEENKKEDREKVLVERNGYDLSKVFEDVRLKNNQDVIEVVEKNPDIVNDYIQYIRDGQVRVKSFQTTIVSLLDIACIFNNKEIVDYLIGKGVNVNGEPFEKDVANYKRPIFRAAENINIDIIVSLVEAGANLNVTTNIYGSKNYTFVYLMLKLYFSKSSFNAATDDLEKHENKIVEMLKMVRDRGMDLAATPEEKDFLTLVQQGNAYRRKNNPVVTFLKEHFDELLEKEIELWIESEHSEKHVDRIIELIQAGANIDYIVPGANMHLHLYALVNKSLKLAEFLLGYGVDYDARIENKDEKEFYQADAFWLACRLGYNEIVDSMITLVPEHFVPHPTLMSPLHIAALNGHAEVVEVLCKNKNFYNLNHKSSTDTFNKCNALIALIEKLSEGNHLEMSEQINFLKCIGHLVISGLTFLDGSVIRDQNSKGKAGLDVVKEMIDKIHQEKGYKKISNLIQECLNYELFRFMKTNCPNKLISVKAILSLGANPSGKNRWAKNSESPLYLALNQGLDEVAAEIISKCDDPSVYINSCDYNYYKGVSAYEIAVHKRLEASKKAIIMNYKKINGTLDGCFVKHEHSIYYEAHLLMVSSCLGDYRGVEILLNEGVFVDQLVEGGVFKGMTPLYAAIRYHIDYGLGENVSSAGLIKVIEMLLNNGANPVEKLVKIGTTARSVKDLMLENIDKIDVFILKALNFIRYVDCSHELGDFNYQREKEAYGEARSIFKKIKNEALTKVLPLSHCKRPLTNDDYEKKFDTVTYNRTKKTAQYNKTYPLFKEMSMVNIVNGVKKEGVNITANINNDAYCFTHTTKSFVSYYEAFIEKKKTDSKNGKKKTAKVKGKKFKKRK